MNVHPDMLRQGVPTMHQGLINQPFLPQQPPQGQQPTPHNILLQNSQGANPGLGLMGGQQGAPNPNYQLNMQQPSAQRRPPNMFIHPNGAGMNPGGAGLNPNQLQSMPGFPSGAMMHRPRVQSQLGSTGPHMQPGMVGGGMGLNGPPQIAGMRQNVQHQQMQQMQHMRQQQQQQQQQQGGGMTPEMGLPMSRLPPHARQPSGQPMMPTLAQTSPLSQSHGMQQQMQHGAFANPMLSHQSSQLGPSQLVGSNGQQSGMGGAMASNQMPPQQSGNRPPITSDSSMFMPYQNSSMQPQHSHSVRGIPQFNMASSPTPLNVGGDMSQRGNGPMNQGSTTQSLMTPAQALDHMNTGSDFSTGSYGMGQSQVSAPPRPPSHNGPHNAFSLSQSQPSHPPPHQSPRQPDRLPATMHAPGPSALQRPQSQPSQAPQLVHQPSLPMHTAGGMLPPTRVPTAGPGQSPQGSSQQPAQQSTSAPPSAHPVQLAPRPPTASASTPSGPVVPAASTSSASSSTQHNSPEGTQPPQSATSVPVPAVAPPAPPRPIMYPLGFGQGAVRLLQLSGALSAESKERLKMSYWQTLVQNYFTDKATMKLTLWKDNQQVEAKPFEIGYPIFPRFFLVTSQSGVKSQTITIDGARERITSNSHALIECPAAAWTFRYTNGYSITLRGPFTADIVVHPLPTPQPQPGSGVLPYVLKIERLQFDAFWHDKYLAFDAIHGERIPDSPRLMPPSPGNVANANGVAADGTQNFDPNRFDEPRYLIDHAIIPAEPINAFGIPQATMRCLELAESVAQMAELIQFSIDNRMGPVDALTAFADRLRSERGNRGAGIMEGIIPTGAGPSSYPDGLNGATATPGPSGSFALVPGPSHPTPSGEQQNASHGEASMQTKAAPQPAQASGSTPSAQASTPASAPTPGGPTTPSMANATLKRKAPPGQRTGEESPTTATAEQQPAKRANRKRGRTQGSGT